MNEIVIPLVSPLSRKYYAYASEKSEHIVVQLSRQKSKLFIMN